jgi:hypothetical protein
VKIEVMKSKPQTIGSWTKKYQKLPTKTDKNSQNPINPEKNYSTRLD